MNLTFAEAITALGPDAVFRIANAQRSPADYLFATFLPERMRPTYDAKSGSMTVRSTMAGLVGADSPYPPTGAVDLSTFNEQTAKVAAQVPLTEMALRELQQLLQSIGFQGGTAAQSGEAVSQTALNFLNKVIVQALLDTFEYLRGEAMTSFAIDWTFNQKRLQVDYGAPAGHLMATAAGANGYGGATSTFWADMRAARTLLKGAVRARLASPTTIDMIVSNAANNVRIIAQDDEAGTMTIGRLVGTPEQLSSDARDRLTLISYGAEGEILDPANLGKTIAVPFLSDGKVVHVGAPPARGFQVGLGSTEDPNNTLALGYTHLAPTVEGKGRMGIWADLYTPENQPWQLVGRGAANVLPVIENPDKLVVSTTDMA